MVEEQAILFWLSGVIIQSRFSILLEVISEAGGSKDFLSTYLGFKELDDRLTLGLIDDLDYCQTLCNLAHIKIKSETLKEKIITTIRPKTNIYDTINLLPAKFQRWLVVDYPSTWFNQISEIIEDHLSFLPERRINLSKCNLKVISPDVFFYLPNNINVPIGQCLLVDNDPNRVIQAINYGLPSVIFVDEKRLEREFRLRKFIP